MWSYITSPLPRGEGNNIIGQRHFWVTYSSENVERQSRLTATLNDVLITAKNRCRFN